MGHQDRLDFTYRLAEERRARMAAERLLEQKSRELLQANAQLSAHARNLTDEIVVRREEIRAARSEASSLKGQNDRVLQDLNRANQAILKAERRLWESLETLKDGFAVFDAELKLVTANRAFILQFGGSGVSVGWHYTDVLCQAARQGQIDTDDQNPEDWASAMASRLRDTRIEPVVLRFWDETYIRLIERRGNSGDIVVLSSDITEAMQNEADLSLARQKAEAANRAKSAFLANMSHEIRTPMNGVVGMADLLAETQLDEEQRTYVETIKNSGEALLVIINDVLDYSKIEAEKLTLYPQPFDLERTIHEVLLLLRPSVQDRDVDMVVDYDFYLPTCFVGDQGRIRQILTNLTGNAAKFTEAGHVLIRVIGLPTDQPDSYQLNITVEDTGIGIEPEKLQHILVSSTK